MESYISASELIWHVMCQSLKICMIIKQLMIHTFELNLLFAR